MPEQLKCGLIHKNQSKGDWCVGTLSYNGHNDLKTNEGKVVWK